MLPLPGDDSWYIQPPCLSPTTVECHSSTWQQLMAMIMKIAPSNASVLLHGERGSGKEVAARALHAASSRRDHRFLAINCGVIKGDFLKSALFGYEKGRSSETEESKSGLLAAAEGGTLFIDEVGEMSGAMQISLLSVLHSRQYRQVGGTRTFHADVRFIAATHRDLQDLVLAGRFCDDLLYHINTVGLRVPPLRDRIEDIPLLAQHFLSSLQPAGRPARLLSPSALEALVRYPWPGNVRELINVIARLILFSTSERTDPIEAEEIVSVISERSPCH